MSSKVKSGLFAFFFCIPFLLSAQVKSVKHVILIGVDGMGANYLAKAPAGSIPNMTAIMNSGAYTMHARCVSPSSSAVNWASIFMGAGPELHGYTTWDSKTPEIPSRELDQYGLFPTIYALLREQQPKAKTAAIYTWPGIGYLFPKKAVNHFENTNNDSLTADHAAGYIETEKPTFLFVHFDGVDHAGHTIGWGTDTYYNAIHQIDAYVGEIRTAIKNAGMEENTVVMVTADHGGLNKGHGGKSIQEMEIPWMITGKPIKSDTEIKQSIMTYDTPATIAYMFGLKTPQVWIGRRVKAAFK